MSQYQMNDLRNPLGNAFYDLTQQVEALGGSPELTAVVVAIGALRDQVGAAIAAQQPEASGAGEREAFETWYFNKFTMPVRKTSQGTNAGGTYYSYRADDELFEAWCAALASKPPADNWQQYAKEGETAQACIERHRREHVSLLRLLAEARQSQPPAGEQKPVVRIRSWTENGEGHGDLVDWLEGSENLPDGEYDLYLGPQTEQKPVASIYISPNGEREFDDWKHDLPVGRNELYTGPQPEQVAQDKIDAERWRAFISLPYAVRSEWAANLSLAPVLTGWVDSRASYLRVGDAPARGDEGLSESDADQLELAIGELEDDGETMVDYDDLMWFALRGYLHCKYFEVTPEAQAAIDAARTRGEQGGAV